MEASVSTPTSAATPVTPAAAESRLELDKIQVKKAVKALLAHSRSRKNANEVLLNENENLFLMVVLWKIPKKELRVRLSLPYAIRPDLAEVCLFTKDEPNLTPEKTEHFYRNLLNKHNIKTVSQIIPLRTLKKEYKPYEAKLRLLGSFDFFLTDARIRRLLPSIIGKHFYLRKKVPVCVNLLAKDLSKEINDCIGGTIMNISKNGSCSTIRVGHTGMMVQHIIENVIAVTKGLSEKLPEKWESVKLLYLKTEKSVALPIFSSFVSSFYEGKGGPLTGQKKKEAKKKQKEKLQKKKEKKRRKREMQQAAKTKKTKLAQTKDKVAAEVSGAPAKSPGPQKGETLGEKEEIHRGKAQRKVGDGSEDEIPLLVPMEETPAKKKKMQKGATIKKSPSKSPGPGTPVGKKRKASSALETTKVSEPGTPGKGLGKKPRIKEEAEKERNAAPGKKDPRQTPKKPGPKFFATSSKSARKTPQTPKQQPKKPKVPQST
ncbi:ribosomal L1 domain-containing protein 1 [Trichechus manatus latirostris]|uniref:Ribosomal L1 domain-containing protein 1 n=1 Tax=Trichechus manatus latirostris TaxID=127582 RepID=A0A2Y9QL93_TRIMA|nr:ribosomal L1 domain-containing protein 1 [Trichechus manatus latirostris]